jgi:hypothetical protein
MKPQRAAFLPSDRRINSIREQLSGRLVSRPSTLDRHVRMRAKCKTYPAADVVDFARPGAEHIMHSLETDEVSSGSEFLAGAGDYRDSAKLWRSG